MVRPSSERSNIEQPRRTRRHREAVRRPIFHPYFENLEVRITPTTRIWSGALNNLWTQGANWTGGVAPSSGDDLLFPATASQHATANNFANGTSFASITITDSGYHLIGNAINLAGGISTTYVTGTSLDEIDTTFGVGGAGISVSSGGELDLVGVLAGLGGMTLSGGGSLNLTGINANSYTGTTTVNAGTLLLNKTGGLAVPGDLVIGDGSGSDLVRETSSNQIADSSNVTVNSSGTLDFNGGNDVIGALTVVGGSVTTLGGNLTLGGVLTMTSGSVATQSGLLTLGGDVNTNAASTTATISGNLDLGGTTRTFTITDNNQTDPDVSITANISGTGAGIIKAGANSRLDLSGNNTYDGATSITAGALSVSSANALGATSAGTVVNFGASLALLGGVTFAAEPLTINGPGFGSLGAIFNGNGSNTLTGPITLGSASGIGVLGGDLTISGQITDGASSFALTKRLSGTLALSNANPYDGGTNINAGVVSISNNSALGTGSATVSSGAGLTLSGGITVSNNVSFAGSGMSGNGAIRSLSGNNVYSGTATLTANASQIQVDAGQLDISGNLDDNGNGYVTNKTGSGLLLVSGTLTSSGSLRTVAGEVRVTGSYSSTVTLAGGDISATGTIGSINQVSGAVGTINPGLPGGTAILTTQNGYAVSTGATTHIDIQSTTAGTGYDQIANTTFGSVILTDSTLAVSLINGYIPAIGDTFTIIDKQNSGAVIGTFHGLPEGAMFTSGIMIYQVSYVGGTGNDVTLTALLRVDTWNGLGGDSNWSTAANWASGIVPVAGDQLVFPVSAAQTTNVNNLTAGTNFDSIIIAAAGYNVSGNAIRLDNGLTESAISGTSTFSINTTLNANQTFHVANGGTLAFSGTISSGAGVRMTKTGGGTLSIDSDNGAGFNGVTTINGGVLAIGNDKALGSGLLTINGGEVDLFGDISVANAISVATAGTSIRNTSGANRLNGAIDLFNDVTIDVAASSALLFGGVISEGSLNRSLTKTSSGTLQLSGTNTYNGGTNIQAGQLRVLNSQATGTSGTVTVASGASFRQSSSSYTLPSGGLLIGDNAGTATYLIATSQAYTLNGSVTLVGPTNFAIFTTGSLNVTGVIGGSASLALANNSTGTLKLSATSTYTGSTSVSAGTLRVDGDISSSSAVSLGGGTLTGNGTIPNVFATGGTVFPGNNPGILHSGSVTLGSNTTFSTVLDGTVAGTGYSQLIATGAVDLGGATLQESLSGYTPGVGDKLTILKNNSGSPITGTFGGLPEGATFTLFGSTFSISYVGGVNHQDVVLSYVVSTNTAVSSSHGSATYGEQLIFTALVTSSGGTPTGSVLFYDGPIGPSTLLGSGSLNNLGIAAYTTSTLSPAGSPYAITAVYQGVTLFAGSTSTSYAQTVSRALLNVTGDPNTRQYGDANPTFTYTVNGFVNGETLATSDVTGSAFIGTTATPSSPVSGNPYQIMVGPGTLSSIDYNFSFTSSQFVVTPASLTVTADAQTRKYGDPNPTLTATLSGFKNGETLATSDVAGSPSLTTSATSNSSVSGGPYMINAAAGTLTSGNYTFSYANSQLSICKATLTVTADSQSRLYGDANPTLTISYTGFKNGETLATSDLTGSPVVSTTATPTSPVAGSPFVITAAPGTQTSGNYSLDYVDGPLTITIATLIVEADDQSKVYGNALPTFTATFSGFKNGETLATSDVTGSPSLTTLATSASHVSGNPYLVDNTTGSLASGNYSFVLINGLLSVTPAALTIVSDDQSKVYGSALPTLSAGYNGFVNGDTAANLTTLPTLSTTATATSSVSGSPYAITASGAVDTDYSISYVGGQLILTPASLTITANDAIKAYGASLPSLSASFSGFVNGDTSANLTTQPTVSTTGTAASHVAGSPYAVGVSGAFDSNYSINYLAGRLFVTPVPLTITANNASKLYGVGLPVLTASYSGFVNGDTAANLSTLPVLSTTATASAHVAGSPYGIAASGAIDPDYTISYAGGQLTVTPATLTITADNQSKVYGAPVPTLTASYSGLVNGDTAASLTTPPTLSTIATASSSVAGSPYVITPSGSVDTDYVMSYIGGQITVTSALLTISANNASKAYGATLPSLSVSYSGFVNGDTLANLTTQPTISTTANSASHVAGSPYAVTASGAVDGNYSITYVAGDLSVTPVALTITANDAAKVYGAALPSLTGNFNGFVNGDTSANLTTQPAFSTSATLASHVAGNTYPTTGSGASDADYVMNYVSGQLTVVPAPLTITANDASKVYGSPVPPLSSSFNGFVNGDTSTNLTTQPTMSTTATAISSVAGGPYSVTSSGAVDSDYAMSYVTGQLTVGQAATTVALSTSSATTIYGQPVTFTANVAVNAPGTGTPTGTVTFQDGSILLGTVPLSGNVATLQISSLAPATHGITATYNGDDSFSSSPQGFVIQTIEKGTPVAALTQSTNVMTSGQPLTLTVSVTSAISVPVNPLGIVNFYADQTLLGQAWVINGQATITTVLTALQSTSHLIYGVYLGDQEFNAVASNQGNVSVNSASTITATTSTLVAIPINASGKTIGSNLVATIASTSLGFGVPTGTVTYSFNGNNWVALPLVNGVASKFVSSANLIGKTFTVKYSGDATHTPSGSSSLVVFGQKVFNAASRPMMALARRGHVLSLGRGRQG